MTTIRERLESIGSAVKYDMSLSAEEVVELLCDVIMRHQEDAGAALAILDNAERDCFDHDKATGTHNWVRLVPDPERDS